MPEMIDKQSVLEIAMSYCPDDDGCCSKAGRDIREMLDEIEALSTIEAEPVRRGRWIFVGEETMHDGWTYRKYKCSECDFLTVEAINFCQNCGTNMREESDYNAESD